MTKIQLSVNSSVVRVGTEVTRAFFDMLKVHYQQELSPKGPNDQNGI